MTNAEKARSRELPGVGDVIADRYEVTGKLGEGGMGLILRARQLSMDREVAIKLVRPEVLKDADARKRFEREVHVAKSLVHPHVVQLFDFGEVDGMAYIVMELLQGETLYDLIHREGPFSVGRALDVTEQVLDALTTAHRQNVVHRDLKPPNIFITQAGRKKDFVKVLDFGIARPLDDPDFKITNTGFISGTLPYMAPEVLARNELTPAADVYAAGLILLEMMFRRYIFIGDNPAQITLQHMRLDPPIPQSLRGTDLEWVLLKAIAKRRDQRYPDADAFLDALVKARKKGSHDEERVLTKAEVDEAFQGFDRDMVDDLLPESKVGNDKATVVPGSREVPGASGAETAPAQPVAPHPAPSHESGPQLASEGATRRSMWPMAVAVALLLAGVAALAIVATRSDSAPEPPAQQAQAPASTPAEPAAKPPSVAEVPAQPQRDEPTPAPHAQGPAEPTAPEAAKPVEPTPEPKPVAAKEQRPSKPKPKPKPQTPTDEEKRRAPMLVD